MEAKVLSGAALPPLVREALPALGHLYVVGVLPRCPAVAVVGTRHPTREAVAFTRELAGELAAAGVAVLSGGAEGIDAAAHEGALRVGGVTVVVAPSAFERPYPEQHAELFESVVAAGGAHVTREPPGTAADCGKFFPRNRLLVALAQAVVVVEAGFRSGARNAAKHARDLMRPLFVVPAVPWNPRGCGCILELKLGARPLAAADDVLEHLRERRLHAIPEPGAALAVERMQLPLELGPPAPGEGGHPTAERLVHARRRATRRS